MFDSFYQLMLALWIIITGFFSSTVQFFSATKGTPDDIEAQRQETLTTGPITRKRMRLPSPTSGGSHLPRHALEKNRKSKARNAARRKIFAKAIKASQLPSPVTGTVSVSHEMPGTVMVPDVITTPTLSAISSTSSASSRSVSTPSCSPLPETPDIPVSQQTVPRIVASNTTGEVDITDQPLGDQDYGLGPLNSSLASRRGFIVSPISIPKPHASFTTIFSPSTPSSLDSASAASAFSKMLRSSSPKPKKCEKEPVSDALQEDYNLADPFASSASAYFAPDSVTPVPVENIYNISFYTELADSSASKPNAVGTINESTTIKAMVERKMPIHDHNDCTDDPIGLTCNSAHVSGKAECTNYETRRHHGYADIDASFFLALSHQDSVSSPVPVTLVSEAQSTPTRSPSPETDCEVANDDVDTKTRRAKRLSDIVELLDSPTGGHTLPWLKSQSFVDSDEENGEESQEWDEESFFSMYTAEVTY